LVAVAVVVLTVALEWVGRLAVTFMLQIIIWQPEQ
jgi:hypothetical protein